MATKPPGTTTRETQSSYTRKQQAAHSCTHMINVAHDILGYLESNSDEENSRVLATNTGDQASVSDWIQLAHLEISNVRFCIATPAQSIGAQAQLKPKLPVSNDVISPATAKSMMNDLITYGNVITAYLYGVDDSSADVFLDMIPNNAPPTREETVDDCIEDSDNLIGSAAAYFS